MLSALPQLGKIVCDELMASLNAAKANMDCCILKLLQYPKFHNFYSIICFMLHI